MTIGYQLPQDHPRAAELLSLAKQRDDESRQKLLALLDELGLPHDTFRPADGAVLPRQDEVLIGDQVCSYEITEHVLEVRGAVPFAQDLINRAEHVNAWKDSTQVQGGGSTYVSENRTSKYMKVTKARFRGLYDQLRDVLWDTAHFYQCWNRHVAANRDSDWEILKYLPGDKFGEHVDAIAGSQWHNRQLTCLVYLNDGFEGGETNFPPPGPGLKIKPEAGKAVLFPPFYTHPHEGLPVVSGAKYVILGWFYP